MFIGHRADGVGKEKYCINTRQWKRKATGT